MLDEDIIKEKLSNKKLAEILETNLEKKKYLVENAQLPDLKQKINKKDYANLNAINDIINGWDIPKWRSIIKELIKKASGVANDAPIDDADDDAQKQIREKISDAIDTETRRLNSEIKKYDKINAILPAGLGE